MEVRAELQQWDLKRIEFIFFHRGSGVLPVRSDNPAVAEKVEQRHGWRWLIPYRPEWEFQSEVWEYEREAYQ